MNLEQGARLAFLLAVFLIAAISNASVGVLMSRFKNLRTIPNILILSSCIADILNLIFNIPGFVASYVTNDSKYFVGRNLALALSTSHFYFVLVNLTAMTLMMLDRLCAFKFGIAYRTWRTRSKAFKAIAAKWILCFVTSMVLLVTIWDVDLGTASIKEYRYAYFSKRKTLISLIIFPFFMINNAVVAIVTCSVINRQSKINAKKMGLNQLALISHARKLQEVKAIKTIGITVLVFFVCYIPPTVYGIMNRMGQIKYENYSWFGFAAYFSLFLPGLMNPFIYAIRTRRFRKALKCFMKDPLGNSEIPSKHTQA